MGPPKFCQHCGAATSGAAHYCANCGASLADIPNHVDTATEPAPMRRSGIGLANMVFALLAVTLVAVIGALSVTQLFPMLGWVPMATETSDPVARATPELSPSASPSATPRRTERPRSTPRPTPRPTPQPTLDADAVARARTAPLLLVNTSVGNCLLVSAASARYDYAIPSGYGFSTEATPGYKFASVLLTVENLCSQAVYSNPFDFTLVGADGRIYNHDEATYALDALVYEGGTIQPSTSAQGALIFEISEGDAPVLLVMESLVDSLAVDLLHGTPADQ